MTDVKEKAAAVWAAGYGALAVVWTVTGSGFPYGPDAPHNTASLLRALDPAIGAPIFAVVLLTAAAALVAIGAERLPAVPRRVLLGYLWLVAAALLVLVPDVRLLTVAGYLPMLIGGLPFGWPPIDYAEIFTWTLANEVLAVAGGLLIVRAVLRRQRRAAGACEDCGRTESGTGWTTPASATRWGRIAVWIAVIIPSLYAVVRLAWAAGIPLGIEREFLTEMQETGLVWAGAGLGTFALAGAVLTLGLTQRWGERFPRWMIGLAGREVPIRLATVPATLVALFVFSGSISLYTAEGSEMLVHGGLNAATIPGLLWPLWGAALGAAAYAYHLRRRPPCPRCGRPEGVSGLVQDSAADAY
ncbi:hypothetical protein FB565_003773 [Actinoplanes lutulentus]|uniref:Uncharacterized protein n=1 Tax=Actinoplanes lutulentus TaxID=1287878 RepID=A0A327ZJC1_9ACTN|nr:hypothetical protein [Actinoplanes lutulentus]MBB2944044.1 hypothetical protein [Actinoplanes lutulentus]RAK42723.1 hypothetical protein B0I29_102549 [Actinoplanes lutulentus]